MADFLVVLCYNFLLIAKKSLHFFEAILDVFLYVEEGYHFIDLTESLLLIFDSLLVLLFLDLFAEDKIDVVFPFVAFFFVFEIQLEDSLLRDNYKA